MENIIKLKHFILVLVTLHGLIPGFSQPPPIKWGKIEVEDVQINYKDYYSDAVVLCDFGRVSLDLNNGGNRLFVFYDRHIRIKILTEKGLSLAKRHIDYYNLRRALYYEGEVITVKAQTINVKDNGEVEKHKVRNRHLTRTDLPDNISRVSFEWPDVKPGSIIEVQYRIATLDVINPEPWYFQDSIPVIWSEFRAEIPRNFYYKFALYNINQLDINEEKYYTQTLNWTYNFRNENFRGGVAPAGYYRGIARGSFSVNGNAYRFVRKNVPSLPGDPWVADMKDYYEAIKMKLSRGDKSVDWGFLAQDLYKSTVPGYEMRDKGEIEIMQIPAGYVFYSEPSVEELNRELNRSTKFGLPLRLKINTGDTLKMITDEEVSDLETMKDLYSFVQDRIRWNGKYSVFLEEGLPREIIPVIQKTANLFTKEDNPKFVNISLNKPYQDREGTSSEINMILINLLRYYNIEAYPVMVSTRGNRKIDTSFFNVYDFNHIIAMVMTEEGAFLLDASDSLAPYYHLPSSVVNGFGLVIKTNDPHWISIHDNGSVSKISCNLSIAINRDTGLKYTGNYYYSGEKAYMIRKALNKNNKDSLVLKLLNIENSVFKSFNLSDEKNIEAPLKINIIANTPPLVRQNTIDITMNKLLLINLSDINPFENKFRAYPLELPSPVEYSFIANWNIPEEFEFDTIPGNIVYSLRNNLGSFTLQSEITDRNYQVLCKLLINQSYFSKNEFSELFELLRLAEKKLNERIILKKKGENI